MYQPALIAYTSSFNGNRLYGVVSALNGKFPISVPVVNWLISEASGPYARYAKLLLNLFEIAGQSYLLELRPTNCKDI